MTVYDPGEGAENDPVKEPSSPVTPLPMPTVLLPSERETEKLLFGGNPVPFKVTDVPTLTPVLGVSVNDGEITTAMTTSAVAVNPPPVAVILYVIPGSAL